MGTFKPIVANTSPRKPKKLEYEEINQSQQQEWRSHLRTSVHPYLFASTFTLADKLSNLLSLAPRSRAATFLAAPRVLQAFWAAWMDFCTWKLAAKLYPGPEVRGAALALTVGSPWQWFCSTRTFSNSLEATLTVGALLLFPWRFFLERNERSIPKGLWTALTAAAAAFYFRPTNIIIWIAISAGLVWCNRSLPQALTLLQYAALVGTGVIVLFAGVDRIYYGEWAFPPLKFLYINLFQSLAVFYGQNRVDYYFTEGLPLLLTTALPFAAIGLWGALCRNGDDWQKQTRSIFAAATLITVISLSTIAHKEMRFIYPLLPILHVLAARPLAAFPYTRSRKTLLLVGLVVNIFIAYYTTMIHQRGVIDVIHYLRNVQESRFNTSGGGAENLSVGFLMPCHSTPWRSHLIYPEIDAWALTCEPPLGFSMEERATYLDEADVFYEGPQEWLEANMGKDGRAWPECLVFFEHLEGTVKATLEEDKGYKECRRFFNTQWHDDGRRMGDVIVFCRGGGSQDQL